MSLYFPDNPGGVDLTLPRLHALIIGVGDYPHLIGGGGHPAVTTFGLQQLTTTVITAKKIAAWLATDYANPSAPLGSIELLLSPAQQVTRPDGAVRTIGLADMAGIRSAFNDWWQRCNAQPGNIAFFYFAGHGINTASQYVLPADFGAPGPNLWANCLDFDGMRVGMRANQSDTQLFFADACREKPIDALAQLNPAGESLANSTIFDQVTSSAAYYAAADGLQAYGPSNDVTFFASALLDALDGAGALNTGGGHWVVDTFSLGNALGHIMKGLAEDHQQPLTCSPSPSGKPAPIHVASSGLVRTSIACASPQANVEASIKLTRGGMSHTSAAGRPRPWTVRVHPGDWAIDLSFTTLAPVHHDDTLMPPVWRWKAPV